MNLKPAIENKQIYDVTDGEVLLNGVNVRDLDLQSLRKAIGIVQQDVYLFWGTVMENIRYGNSAASDDEVIRAAIRLSLRDRTTRCQTVWRSKTAPKYRSCIIKESACAQIG